MGLIYKASTLSVTSTSRSRLVYCTSCREVNHLCFVLVFCFLCFLFSISSLDEVASCTNLWKGTCQGSAIHEIRTHSSTGGRYYLRLGREE